MKKQQNIFGIKLQMTVLPYPGQSLMEPQCINDICVAQFTNQYSAVITLRVDRRAIPMRQTMKASRTASSNLYV